MPPAVAADRWTERRRRAGELRGRWLFAGEVLGFYTALLDAQEPVYRAAGTEISDPSQLVAYVVDRALPIVTAATAAHAPETLARAAAGLASRGGGVRAEWEAKVSTWLDGGTLPAVDRYLVRAAAGPVLEALGPGVERAGGGTGDARHCPHCGGPPQVSLLAAAAEELMAPRRYLECSRCAWRWLYPRMTCAACGETETRQLPIFGEEGTTQVEATGSVVRGLQGAGAGTPPVAPRFPHVSVHACTTCSRYLLNIDLSRDPGAVPAVDELAAIPLDLYAKEQGVTKVVPNLMGF